MNTAAKEIVTQWDNARQFSSAEQAPDCIVKSNITPPLLYCTRKSRIPAHRPQNTEIVINYAQSYNVNVNSSYTITISDDTANTLAYERIATCLII